MSLLRRMLAVGCFFVASRGQQARAELKIDEALRAALDSNERSRIAALRVQTSAGQYDRARAAFFPSLTFGTTTAVTPNNGADRWRTTSATLTLSQPLINPSAMPQKKQAAHNLEAEQHGAVEDQRQLAFNTARAFIQALAAERVLKAAESRLERARANFENADARAKAQLNSSNDATRARVDLASATATVAQGRSSHQQALLQLGLLMGRPVQDTIAPPEALSEAAKTFRGDPTQLTRSAIENRPDLRSLREQIHSADASAAEPLYRLVPTVNIAAQIRGNFDSLTPARRLDESLSLTLNWTIFDGGGRYADRRSRLAQADSLRLQQQLQYRTVNADVRSALVLLDAARQSLEAAEEGVAAAQTNTDETLILYRQGLARAIELTDANGRRFDAEVSLASARQSLVEAYLQLRQVLGLTPIDNLTLPVAGARHAPPASISSVKDQ